MSLLLKRYCDEKQTSQMSEVTSIDMVIIIISFVYLHDQSNIFRKLKPDHFIPPDFEMNFIL